MSIAARVANVRRRIDEAAGRAGRPPSSITLVAVSKTFPADAVREAAQAGVRHFGENRAQELVAKASQAPPSLEWHFVGSLQTNKVRLVVGRVRMVHSVDSVRLAHAISRRARADGIEQAALVEVNVAGERSKSGVSLGDAPDLAREVARLEGIRVAGLMTIPPYPDDPEASRPFYAALAAVRNELSEDLPNASELSMGMTRDFEVAIEEGATIIRVGRAIFGSRG